MHLDSTLERIRLIDPAAADEVQAMSQNSDLDQRIGALSAAIDDLDAAERIHSGSISWAKLAACFTALAQAHGLNGAEDKARESFQRAAIYGLLIGDALLRSNSLQAAENVSSLTDSQPVSVEGDSDSAATAPRHAAPEDAKDMEVWATADELTELAADEFVHSIEDLASRIGTADEELALSLIEDCYKTLATKLSKASQDDDGDRQILISERVIAASQATVPPSTKLLSDSIFSKTIVLAGRGYSPQLRRAVSEAVEVLQNSSEPNDAAETLMLCYRSLVSMTDASSERHRLLQAAGAQFNNASNMTGALDCSLEMGVEYQRTGQFAPAFSIFQNVAGKAGELRLPGVFTKACSLLGDSWGFAIREKKIDVNNGIMRAANEYRRAVSTFPEDEYISVEDKRNLAMGLLKMAALLRNRPEAASSLNIQPSVFASNANRIFTSIGDEPRAQQALEYM